VFRPARRGEKQKGTHLKGWQDAHQNALGSFGVVKLHQLRDGVKALQRIGVGLLWRLGGHGVHEDDAGAALGLRLRQHVRECRGQRGVAVLDGGWGVDEGQPGFSLEKHLEVYVFS
jgi:hypothetical protein